MDKAKAIITCLALLFFVFSCSSTREVQKLPEFNLKEPILSKGIERNSTNGIPIPGNIAKVFSTQDPEVIASLKLENLSKQQNIRWDWLTPDGALYHSTGNHPIKVSEGKYFSETMALHRLPIQGERAENYPGMWKVKIYLDNALIASKAFEIMDDRRGIHWAVVIGISEYQDPRIPKIRYADRDAQSFYDWLISSEGGRYHKENVKLLINSNGSYKEIRGALFEWLKQVLEEDIVTIYFAGHGSPDSPKSSNLFLYPHDVDYNNIATTGFPMWDIRTALERFIKAKKIIVIVDACHSGGVGQSFDISRRDGRGIIVNPISESLQNLSDVSDGVCILSASNEGQLSQEGEQWGDGHGVFTYYLLDGLKGKANLNKDEHVTLGELTSYVSEHVRRATKNEQSPVVSGNYDPALCIHR